MQAESVISNSITQDIRLKGHQSIRFSPDGFSILLSDAAFTPVFLQQFTFEQPWTAEKLAKECGQILKDADLLSFEGETVLITDSMAVTLIPEEYYDVGRTREILEQICSVDESDRVVDRYMKDRNLFLVYAVPEKIDELKKKFSGRVRMLHNTECLISLSDQIKSSEHRGGFLMAEVQTHTLDILVIIGERIQLLNRYSLNDPSDFIYHCLNTMKQLELDREAVPVYLSGIIHKEHDLYSLLRKYIRNVIPTPYYLELLSSQEILRYMILSEGSRCE
jgi:hypothetical protein